MKSAAVNNSNSIIEKFKRYLLNNSIIEKIKRDFSNILDMLTSLDEISENEFPITTNSEAEVEILEESRRKLDAIAIQFEDNIGVPSRSKKQVNTNTNTNTKKQVHIETNKYQSSILSTPLKREDSTKTVERSKNEDLTK